MNADIVRQLEQIAPDVAATDARWPMNMQADLANAILAGEVGGQVRFRPRPASVRPRRRTVAVSVLAAAAAAVVGVIAVPTLLPEGSPGAASPAAASALHRLADIAAATPADSFRPGQFVHTTRKTEQVGVPGNPELGAVVDDTDIEEWTAYDGRNWSRRTSPGGGKATTYYTHANAFSGATHLASLPANPDDLDRYLRENAHGSSSQDEAVFLELSDILANPTAPAAVRSAAVTVLARTDHVSLGAATKDISGRTVQQFDFIDNSTPQRRGQVQSLFIDPSTAQVIDTKSTQPGSSYAATYEVSEVVESVPADVLASACPVNGPANGC